MKRTAEFVLASVVILFFLIDSGFAALPPYEIIDLDTLGGGYGYAGTIDNAAALAGDSCIIDSVNADEIQVPNAFWSASELGWLYTPGFSYILTGVLTNLGNSYIDGTSPLVTLEVYDGLPVEDANLLRSAQFHPADRSWVGGHFDPLVLTAGEHYFIGFRNVKDFWASHSYDGVPLPIYYGYDNDGTYPFTENGDVEYAMLKFQGTHIHPLRVPADYPTIQAAIDAAVDGDTVLVAEGTYTGEGNRDIDFLGKAITVRSTDPNNPDVVAATIIDCNGTEEEPHRGFYFNRGETYSSILAGLTINNGYAPEKIIYWGDYPWVIRVGGGILFDGSSPTVIGCTVSDCNAGYGGGISCGFIGHPNDSSPTITNCAIQSNSAKDGGGLYFYRSNANLLNCDISANKAWNFGGGVHIWGSIPTMSHCMISGNSAKMWGGGINGTSGYGFPSGQGAINFCSIIGNSAQDGGGVRRFGGSIMNSTISDNKAEFYGGGLDYSDCLIHNCTISGNSAKYGGGLHGCDGTITNCTITGNRAEGELFHGGEGGGFYFCEGLIINCLIAGNKAEVWGGGLHFTYGPIVNCTVSGNSAGNAGGGMYCYWRSHSIITNSIFWANYAPDGPDIHWKLNSTARISYTDLPGGWPGEGNIDTDPCFVEPGYWDANGTWVDGDYHLLADSPCIDTGDPNYIADPNETDLDGRPRIIGGRIDMGAYESPLPAEVRIVPRSINLASKGKWITCYIWLPEEYNVADIEPNSVLLEGDIKPEEFPVDQQKQVAVLRFSREDVQPILEVGDIELTITGQLADGTVFEGTDVIRVIDKGGRKSAK